MILNNDKIGSKLQDIIFSNSIASKARELSCKDLRFVDHYKGILSLASNFKIKHVHRSGKSRAVNFNKDVQVSRLMS